MDMKKIKEELSENYIRGWCGDKSYSRGKTYFRNNAIYDCSIIKNRIEAKCEGSYEDSYELWIEMNETGIAVSKCSCPVGYDGDCKHIAALLLSWLNESQDFGSQLNLASDLQSKSKEELIDFIQRMANDSESTKELVKAFTGVVDIQAIKKQINRAFNTYGKRWVSEREVSDNIINVMLTLHQVMKSKDYENTFKIASYLSNKLMNSFNNYSDEGGYLRNTLDGCIDALGICLKNAREKDGKTLRKNIIKHLLSIIEFDYEYGGIGISDYVEPILVQHCTVAEQKSLGGNVYKKIETLKYQGRIYYLECLGRFYLVLQGDIIDDNLYIKICEDTGLTAELATKLLELEKPVEARELAMKVHPYKLVELAEVFVQNNQMQIIEEVILARPDALEDGRPILWLQEYYISHNQKDSALTIALELYDVQPTFKQYEVIISLIEAHPKKEQIESDLIERAVIEKNSDLPVLIYLAKGDIENAWDLFKTSYAYFWNDITSQVVEAAQKVFPEQVMELYKKQAEYHIRLRGRGQYQLATKYLSKGKSLAQKNGNEQEFTEYVEDLRIENKQLPAFLQELNRAML
ncbi:MAG: SWIM zinc finger family protein [Leptospirales bacterium]